MSRESKLAKNTIILSIGTFIPKVVSFVTLPILTSCLTQEEYGTYELIIVLVSLLLPAITMQIQTAAFRFLIDIRDEEEEVKKIITNVYLFILIILLITIIILLIILQGIPITVRIAICIYFIFDILVSVARQEVRGLSKNIEYSISAIISIFGKVLFLVILVWWLKTGLLGSILSLCFADMLAFSYLLFGTKIYKYIKLRYIDINKMKEMLQYSWPMVPNSISIWVMNVSDRLVVSCFMGVAFNAIYSVANKIPSLLSLAQNTFSMAWQENASIVSKDEDVELYYTSMFHIMFNLMAGFMAVLIGITPILFKILIRGNYLEAYNQMPILFMAMMFYSMSSYLGGIYVAFKRTKSVGITTTGAALCNLIIDISLIQWIGLYAASASTLISYLFLFLFRMFDISKFVCLKYKYNHIVCILVVLGVECIFCFQQKMVLNCINFVIGIICFYFLNKSLIKVIISQLACFMKNIIKLK